MTTVFTSILDDGEILLEAVSPDFLNEAGVEVLVSWHNPALEAWAVRRKFKNPDQPFTLEDPVGHFESASTTLFPVPVQTLPTIYHTAPGGLVSFVVWDTRMKAACIQERLEDSFLLWCKNVWAQGFQDLGLRTGLRLALSDLDDLKQVFLLAPHPSIADEGLVVLHLAERAMGRLEAMLERLRQYSPEMKELLSGAMNILAEVLKFKPLLCRILSEWPAPVKVEQPRLQSV